MPLYRGHASDDWGEETPGFLKLSKGAFVTVFGVEGKYFDAEVRCALVTLTMVTKTRLQLPNCTVIH